MKDIKHIRKLFTVVLLLAAFLIGCGDFSLYSVLDGDYSGPLTISPEIVSVQVNQQCYFTAGGGVTPYTFSNIGIGTIDEETGLYSAPSNPYGDVVILTDATGTEVYAALTVLEPLSLDPAFLAIAVSDPARTFTASGGESPYSFSNADTNVGSLNQTATDTCEYSASSEGSDTLTVTDALGNICHAEVTVAPAGALLINPPIATMTIGDPAITFTASGGTGTGTYTFSASLGNIAITGPDTVDFTDSDEEGTAIITLTDDDSSEVTATVYIYATAQLSINPTSLNLYVGDEHQFTASGGQPPYQFSLQPGDESYAEINPDTGLFTALAKRPQGVIVLVTDALSTPPATATVKILP